MTDRDTHAPPPIYTEHAPAPELRRHVECYWSLTCRTAAGDAQAGRVLPDGCMDILFNLGDPLPLGEAPGGSATVVGSMTRAIDVAYGGRVELLGVRFRPGGATPFLEPPASELTDRTAALDDLWGTDAARVRDRLGESAPVDRAALLDDVLLRRLRVGARAADERVLRASERMAAGAGALPVAELADQTGLGPRQLERRFLACVGIAPKTASRIARFRAVVSRMHADPTVELSRLAHAAGYADQAHMTREFGALAGVPPGVYLGGIRGA